MFVSLCYGRYMSERVVAAVASNPKLARCFNVPFQSGDNDVSNLHIADTHFSHES